MSEDDSAGLAAEPLSSKYLGSLLGNISVTQDHLAGNDGTPLSPSFLQPNAVWTPREKNAFFHAVSVYSRFRPDLISHEIKTKSVPDVCNYLSTLQLAASQQEAAGSYPHWRQNLPIAAEVSPEWVAMEEEMALDVIAREQDWQRELTAEQRHAELKLLKKTFKTEPHDMGPSRRKAELNQEVANANLRDQQKDFYGSLGPLELTAIGTVLREVSDSSCSSQTKLPSVFHTPGPRHSPGHAGRLEATQTLTFSVTKGADMQNPLSPAWRQPNSNGEPSPQNVTELSQAPSLKEDSTASAMLSPASRRRYQKRLYMRRKRASMSGVTVIDDGPERLKPGRKRVKRTASPEDEIPLDMGPQGHGTEDKEGAGGPSTTQKRYPRAKQIAIDELRDLGLAADDLRKLRVDVLNLEGVAKMLNLWDKLSGDASSYGSRISIETIELLSVHMVWFVKNLVYRAITLREQELALKSETKVWKVSGRTVLTREHIERAVSMANSRALNKAGFFEGIITDMGASAGAGGIGGEPVQSGPDVAFPPLHRDIYTPLVWVPELGDDSEMTDDVSDEEVDNELLEEEELDELDMEIEMDHESGLWENARGFQDPKIEGSITKRGQRTAYKSAEFIEDSD